MSSKALSFPFENCLVRVAGTPERPLFINRDVCNALGLTNSKKAHADLDDDEKAILSFDEVTNSYPVDGDGVTISDSLGRKQTKVQVVTESGLYHLIFKSRKAAAKRFRRWVTEEVLPEIRKTGSFGGRARLPEAERLELLYKTKRLLLELNGELCEADREFFSQYVHRLMLSQDPEAEAEFADGSTLTRFVVDCLALEEGASLTTEELYAEYGYYCDLQQVVPQSEHTVQRRLPGLIWRFYRKSKRNDIFRGDTQRRGYLGLGFNRTINPGDAGSVLLAAGR